MRPQHSARLTTCTGRGAIFVFIGATLIGVERKQSLPDVFAVVKEALSEATKFVLRMTLNGGNAIAAKSVADLRYWTKVQYTAISGIGYMVEGRGLSCL